MRHWLVVFTDSQMFVQEMCTQLQCMLFVAVMMKRMLLQIMISVIFIYVRSVLIFRGSEVLFRGTRLSQYIVVPS